MKLLDDTEPSLVIPISDSTLGVTLESMESMKRAVLYARVSTDAQQKEATIESQLFELKRQIAAAGHKLVEEYIDDGITGTLLERPALEQLRQDAKTELFDRIYFHSADRIAREAAHQTIIVGELTKRGKKLTIGGKDYEETPEGKLTLNLLGLFSEYERAKIIERTTRGRLHRLRSGQLASGGHGVFGYDYVRKTADASATLRINDEQAAIIRSIFEMFASGTFGLITICRFLEERMILTKRGCRRWDNDRIKYILTNETYAGTRYFNRITAATEANSKGRQVIRGRSVYRDRAEWIAVKVPAIISRELFDTVQEKLAERKQRYCTPFTHYLLSRLVECGVCGGRCSSSRRHSRIVRPSGKVSVYHQSAYRCSRQSKENMHDRTQFERCGNSEIATHMLEGKVFEMIEAIMLDPARLRSCINSGGGVDDRRVAQQLARVAGKLKALDDERRRIIGVYAAEQMTAEEYITANRALDKDLGRLTHTKAELAAALRSSQHENFVDASIRQFCANANVRFQASADLDAKRQFLVDHIEGVIFNRGMVTITGSVPIQAASGETKLQFRIKGEIKQVARRGNATDTMRRDQPDQIWPEVGALGLQKALVSGCLTRGRDAATT